MKNKFGFVGLCPTPAKNLFENILALLGANLPAAKFAKVLGSPKPFKALLLKVFGFLNPFCKKGLGGVQG